MLCLFRRPAQRVRPKRKLRRFRNLVEPDRLRNVVSASISGSLKYYVFEIFEVAPTLLFSNPIASPNEACGARANARRWRRPGPTGFAHTLEVPCITPEERQLLSALAQRVKNVPPQQKDPEAEQFIRQLVMERPDTPYVLAQTVIMQDFALRNAQSQIEDLQRQLSEMAPPAQERPGSFLGGLFGRSQSPQPSIVLVLVRQRTPRKSVGTA